MLKKVIAYQRLLLNSVSFSKSEKKGINDTWTLIIIIVLFNFMGRTLFLGNSTMESSIFALILSVISVWFIHNIVNKSEGIFEITPISRRFIVINIFIFSVVITLLEYILIIIIGVILLGILVLLFSGNISMQPPETAIQVVDTAKADLLMLIILIIILFVGTMIVFIKNNKIRLSCFSGLYIVVYGLLYLLKTKMPIAPNSDKVEFLESFSIMPEANTILSSLSIAMVLICISSVFIAYRLYVNKSNVKTS